MAEFAIDTAVVQQLVEAAVRENIVMTLENMVQDANWLARVETMINQTATQKTLEQLKTVNIADIVSDQINRTFDRSSIQQTVITGVQKEIETAISNISQDPNWLSKIEKLINQTIAYQTIAKVGSIDINTIIHDRIDENMDRFREKLLANFTSVGISDQATKNQMTVMDDHTVFENNLTARELTVADSAQIQNLIVTGSINTDNFAWVQLANDIQERTLTRLSDEWKETLVQQVAEKIKIDGIDFDHVTIEGNTLVKDGRLSENITLSSLQTVGTLQRLRVAGEANLNNTLNVITRRVGVNTEEPEMALSVWDEEVSINIGKNKEKQAYVGTGRSQSLAIGTNRSTHIEIDADGMTQIKKLRVGVHQISHADMVPGWSGTRGDIVFNSNPTDRVFAWVCLGNFKWQPLKSAE